ncbi:MAG: DUF3596 domain-containing protein [Gloeomargaritaceae cyanobacterium C42_A2020_066]|nr:DUF3596 domain-containing protein [Gloeomargaritaceae cyanobacterium C42_A2020_066]
MPRTPKGQVAFLSSNGRLQLRVSHGGKRYYISTGLPDSPLTRRGQAGRVAEIERDLALGVFDTTLDRYRPVSGGDVAPEPVQAGPTLAEIWDAFTEEKRPQLRETTIEIDYRQIRARIAALPTNSCHDVGAIRDHLLKHHPVRAARKTLMLLNAAMNWAVSEGLIPDNPLAGVVKTIRVPKGVGEGHQPDPFTPSERDAILAGFRTSAFSSRYAPLVEFLFLTGCRPSEAVAVQWGDVRPGKNVLSFRRDAVSTPRGVVLQDGLKTQTGRDFPVNPQLRGLLSSVRPESPAPDELLFRSPRTGGVINWGNFVTRHWRPILGSQGVRYREPYCVRDTFITSCLERGISPVLIARWVGNSAEIILRRYAGVIERRGVPEF